MYLLFLLMTDQFRIVGGDQTPTLCRNEGEGTVVNKSFRIIARVTSVMPSSRVRVQYCLSKRDIRTLKLFPGVKGPQDMP